MVGRADERRLRELFVRHRVSVYRRALRLLRNPADAEEAVQEVFLRALYGRAEFRGRSRMTTWLYRITTNYCLNLIRDRRRRRVLLEESYAGEGPVLPMSPSDLVLLGRLLSEGDDLEARAAIYVYLQGMRHNEAAALLRVSKSGVGNLLNRFRAWAQARASGLI